MAATFLVGVCLMAAATLGFSAWALAGPQRPSVPVSPSFMSGIGFRLLSPSGTARVSASAARAIVLRSEPARTGVVKIVLATIVVRVAKTRVVLFDRVLPVVGSTIFLLVKGRGVAWGHSAPISGGPIVSASCSRPMMGVGGR